MEQSPVELISRQRQRVDALAHAARRFFNEAAYEALHQLSIRLTRVSTTLSTPAARNGSVRKNLQSHLENLIRAISLLRVDELSGVTRVAWIVAEIEESLNTPTSGLMPVYTAN
jgi:hypothetical protein